MSKSIAGRRTLSLFSCRALVRGLAAVAFGVFAAVPALADRDVDDLEDLIPHRESQLERERLLESGQDPILRSQLRADPPPLAPIRNCAEWEPLTGVLIRYPLGLPYSLLRDFDDDLTIHVVVSSGYLSSAKASFVANSVDTTKVQWLVKPNDSIWTRDYGPWFVFDGNGDIAIVDHVYNRPWRPNDNKIPGELGAQLGIPVIGHDMYHTGGNYMTDGALFSMSSDLVYNEASSTHGMTPAQVDALMNDYYGITTYNVVTDIATGGIHHIDTWAKFLDEETVLIKETWTSHYTWSNLEQRATLIGSLISSTGRNYEVHRVYCPNIGGGEPASYTNSLVANERIYVPLFGNAVYDPLALQAYEDAMPGYDVRGYIYGGFITDDALHCRAKGVMDAGMLRVAHVPVKDDTVGPVTIAATVDDRSEAGLAAVELRYRVDGGAWATLSMASVGGDDYEATIPGAGADVVVDYYVLASDLTGREEGYPRVAPAGWCTFNMLTPPVGVDVVGAPDAEPIAYPNPFENLTRFAFELRFPGEVELTVHDVAGRRVRDLAHGTFDAGRHVLEWDARDETGRPVPSGVYFFRLRAAGIVHSRPVVLTR